VHPPSNNIWFLRPPRVHTPNDILIGSDVLTQIMVVTSRQTDTHIYHATRVAIVCILRFA